MSGSAIDRVRAAYEARQKERVLDLELWGGDLVAEVSLVDVKGAQGAFKTLASFSEESDLASLDAGDMADVIAEAVTALYTTGEDGEKELLVSESGAPVVFDSSFGAAIGVPDITTPRAAVFTAFTEGDPPKLNAFALMTAVSQVAAWLVDPTASAEAAAKGS